MNLLLTLNRALELWPERVALVDGDQQFTYKEFGLRVGYLSAALQKLSVKKGSVVAIICPNSHAFMESYYALAHIGAVCAPINFRLSAQETASILNDCGATILISHADFADTAAQAMADCPSLEHVVWIANKEMPITKCASWHYEDLLEQKLEAPEATELCASDLAQLYYTSGTTGKAKGVMLTHGNVTFHALAAIAELALSDSDTWAHIAPMFHLADAWACFAITACGGKHIFVPYFRPEAVLSCFEEHKVTITNLIPTMLNAMLSCPDLKKHNYESLRMLLSGGAPIAPESVRRVIEAFGSDYVQTYGMTETSPYLTLSCLKSHMKTWSDDKQLEFKCKTGRPFLGVDLKVVRADGLLVEKNNLEVGEIIVRGPTVTPGYWKQPEASAEAIKGGWLYTGDLAVIDDESYVTIVDRKKDMILSGGENIYSTEVEHAIYEHPAVAECAVIGEAHPVWGEAVKAFVVTKNGANITEAEIIEFVKERIAGYKAPKSVEFIKELPKTGSGKIAKSLLKEQSCKKSQV